MFNNIVKISSMSCLILGMLDVSAVWADNGIKGIQKEIIKRDRLRCAVSTAAIQKLEERYCRAVALAVLGDAGAAF